MHFSLFTKEKKAEIRRAEHLLDALTTQTFLTEPPLTTPKMSNRTLINAFNAKLITAQQLQRVEEEPVRCFQHCSRSTNILCFNIPYLCPLCEQDVYQTESRIPPYIITSPFVTARETQCCMLVKPTKGTYLRDFDNSSSLHIGITDSKGQVYEFDENGLSINGPNWLQCIAIELTRLTQKHKNKWDRTLQDFAMSPYWSKEQYHETNNNCYDFVILFLHNLGVGRLYPCLADRLEFCKELILPRTHKAGQYISMYRDIQSYGYICQKVNMT